MAVSCMQSKVDWGMLMPNIYLYSPLSTSDWIIYCWLRVVWDHMLKQILFFVRLTTFPFFTAALRGTHFVFLIAIVLDILFVWGITSIFPTLIWLWAKFHNSKCRVGLIAFVVTLGWQLHGWRYWLLSFFLNTGLFKIFPSVILLIVSKNRMA